MAQKPSIPKGTRDFGPIEMAKRNYIFNTIKDVYALYGFQQIETPAMETLLTLMVEPPAPMLEDIRSGKFQYLTPEQVLQETCLLLEQARPEKSCVFLSNHASNYVSLRGNLPEDNDRLIGQLHRCMENLGMLKDERFRML